MISPVPKGSIGRNRRFDFVAVRLPAGQRRRLRKYAAATGRTLEDLTRQAIRELLEKERSTVADV